MASRSFLPVKHVESPSVGRQQAASTAHGEAPELSGRRCGVPRQALSLHQGLVGPVDSCAVEEKVDATLHQLSFGLRCPVRLTLPIWMEWYPKPVCVGLRQL